LQTDRRILNDISSRYLFLLRASTPLLPEQTSPGTFPPPPAPKHKSSEVNSYKLNLFGRIAHHSCLFRSLSCLGASRFNCGMAIDYEGAASAAIMLYPLTPRPFALAVRGI